MVLELFGHSLNHTVQPIKQTKMHCVGWQSTVVPVSPCYHTEPFSFCASPRVCGHSVATSLPVVWTYSLSALSRCLFTWCSTDQTPSPPWCDSPATLMNGSTQRPSTTVKCPLGPHQSQKEQSGLHGHESQLSRPITAVQRQLKRLREKTSGRRRSRARIRRDGKEQPGVSAWWASQAPMAFRAEPLWSESTSLRSSPLKQGSRKFPSPSFTTVSRVWANPGWQKTLSWNEQPPFPSLFLLPIKRS